MAKSERSTDRVALSSVLIGDFVTPHAPTEPFEYVASVVVLDGRLHQVSLLDVLDEYPKDPAATRLTAEQLAAMKKAAIDAEPPAQLLARLDADTLMVAPGFGLANLRDYIAASAPELLGESALQDTVPAETPASPFTGASTTVVIIAIVVLALLAASVWIAVRAVSGY